MTELKRYKAFYCFYGTDRDVPSDQPVDISEADGYSNLLGSLESDGDFFGLIDERGSTLQVMYEADADRYWIEIPVRENGGSYGKHLRFDDVVALFKSLPAHFSTTTIQRLKFISWS